MRKLLVIALVLVFASAAEATVLTWSVDALTLSLAGGPVVVQLIADDDLVFGSPKWVGHTPGSTIVATIVSIAALPAAGGNAAIQNPSQSGYDGWWTVFTVDLETPFTIASGTQYSVTIQPYSLGTCALSSDYYGTNDVLEIIVPIPEPSTVFLLAIGSLALLRKRRR